MGFDLDDEELRETRKRLGLGGKCKNCYGCNLLENFEFKGKKYCKNYRKANKTNKFFLILVIVELIGILFIIFECYLGLSIEVGD